ncbi:hypothetical protein [Oceaniglobus roseus]|uniref:hypothetical protein n=1 Tax=Oceaniglobus roseus TaxID=1737570 RepID=UPI00130011D3|nr:hypothetical protein [Kandeliimicrobium roseum]
MFSSKRSDLLSATANRLALVGFLAVAACTASPGLFSAGVGATRSAAQYALGRLDRLWATPAEALVMVQRRVGRESEQLIGLENDTTLEGDNYLMLIARLPDGLPAGRFVLGDFLARVGGAPYPFRNVSDKSLRSASDSAGTYFWLQYSAGTQTNCVLAFRRLQGSDRLLPRGTNLMEALLRNCVNGSVEEALAPIRDSQIRLGAISNTSAPNGGNRMLSPLAGPPQ